MKCLTCETRWEGDSRYCPKYGSPLLPHRSSWMVWIIGLLIAIAMLVILIFVV